MSDLMSAIQLPLTLAQRHNNQQLFSDHYLNVTLPQCPEWKLLAHDARSALEQIAQIVHSYTLSQNEAQTEDDLIKPVTCKNPTHVSTDVLVIRKRYLEECQSVEVVGDDVLALRLATPAFGQYGDHGRVY
jgi:hypothetical protein